MINCKIVIAVFVFIALTQVLSACLQFRLSDKKVAEYFEKKQYKPDFQVYKVGEREMHYAKIGADSLPTVIFLHGSPGAWDAFIGYLGDSSMVEKMRMISVDRTGFGKSGFGKAEKELEKQAAAIKPILEKYQNGKKIILVGHSYGGPLIARIAMDYPEYVQGLIFLAPSIAPELEKTRWFQYPANWLLLRWMVPSAAVVSNQEIMHLKSDLEEMLPFWENIKCPITYIHGEKDSLVPIENADFAQKKLSNATLEMIRIPNTDHFIPWSHEELIKKAIFHAVATF